jgi:hypothetical protein
MKMSDEEFFAKYGFHYDDLPKATTDISLPPRDSAQSAQGEFGSRQESYQAREKSQSWSRSVDQNDVPSWNVNASEPSGVQEEDKKKEQLTPVLETQHDLDQPCLPKEKPSYDRPQTKWDQNVARPESGHQWHSEASKAERLPDDSALGWGQDTQPETKGEVPAWSFDKTPSGHMVRCPQCQHEFTA